jgi:hypothetical protein
VGGWRPVGSSARSGQRHEGPVWVPSTIFFTPRDF